MGAVVAGLLVAAAVIEPLVHLVGIAVAMRDPGPDMAKPLDLVAWRAYLHRLNCELAPHRTTHDGQHIRRPR